MSIGRRSRRLIVAIFLYIAACTIGGIYLADGTLHPARRTLTQEEVSAFEHDFFALNAKVEDVSIHTADSVVLRAWIVRPEHPNGNAVMLLHGLGDNRLGMVGYARLLLSHGFVVLLPDARAHGASGGAIATYGLLERNDIRQWTDFLYRETRPHCVYGLGESMGAAELLQSLQSGSRFCSVIAESSFSSFRDIAYDRMGQPFYLGPWVGQTILRPLVEVAFLRARWKYNANMQAVSPENATEMSDVPVLLIHGRTDRNIPVRHSERIHANDPLSVLWKVPNADHCGALSVAPKEFESRMLEWFCKPAGPLSSAPGNLYK